MRGWRGQNGSALLSLAASVHRDQLGDDAARRERAGPCVMAGAAAVPPKGHAIYAPWSWMVWWTRWYWAPQLEPLWEQCAREALCPMAT